MINVISPDELLELELEELDEELELELDEEELEDELEELLEDELELEELEDELELVLGSFPPQLIKVKDIATAAKILLAFIVCFLLLLVVMEPSDVIVYMRMLPV